VVACGAAGGIAATFNAPLGGAFFALEVVLAEFSAEAFGLVVVSAVVADAVGRAAFGSSPFLHLPPLGLDTPAQLPLYALLGLVAAPVAIGFTKLLYGAEDAADRIWRGPEAIRPAVGGILLGLLLLAVPQVYGVGYPVLTRAIQGHDAVLLLLALLAAKALATSLTMAIGGSGGVFAPSLFLGAMLGTCVGQAVHGTAPALAQHPGAFGLVGMAAVFAAAARAPVSAALVVFELTGNYQIMLPLLLAVVSAVALASRLSGDTIYTLKLRRRGIAIDQPSPWLERIRVADAMRLSAETLPASATVEEAAAALAHEDAVSVEGDQGLRVAAPEDVERAMGDERPPTLGEIAEPVTPLPATASLAEAAAALTESERSALPVVDGDGAVVGWLGHHEILTALAEEAQTGHRDPASG
jgi:CIC family chloride channel protein